MSRIEFDNPAERIMVALDFDEISEAEILINSLSGLGLTFKVGNQLGTYEGWKDVIELIHESGSKIFCDTKFKDIPETVKKSARAITRHQPEFFNIMADNSKEALLGAVDGIRSAVEDYSLKTKPMLLGVTVLTSIDERASKEIYGGSPAEKVLQFASLAADAKIDGVVCSAQEVKMLRSNILTKDLVLVTPGIRPTWAAKNDQQRIVTPSQAVIDGADYLVIGRPITNPPVDIGTSRQAVDRIIQELKEI